MSPFHRLGTLLIGSALLLLSVVCAPSARSQTPEANPDLPVVRAIDAFAPEARNGLSQARVPIVLSRPSAETVSVSFATADFEALANVDYRPTNGVATFPPGVTRVEIPISIRADSISEGNERFRLELSDPVNAVLGSDAEILILDDDPEPAISVANLEAPENIGEARFEVRLSGPSAQPVRVRYATENASAASGSDYVAQSGILTFAPGETEASVVVPIISDSVVEADEVFRLLLREPVNARLATFTAEARIFDDDRPATIRIGSGRIIEGAAGQTNHLVFPVQVTSSVTNTITVDYITLNGTATAGADFLGATGRVTFVTFEPGVVNYGITVRILGDNIPEPNETFFVRLSNPTNAVLENAEAAGIILNDDGPVLVADDASVVEGDSGETRMVFPIRLLNPPDTDVTVDFLTANATALSGRDYRSSAGRITFRPGSTLAELPVAIFSDSIIEPDETFHLHLSAASGATLQRASAVGTIIDDDVPTVNVDDASLLEGSIGASLMRFTLRLSAPPANEARVDYHVEAGTATAGIDFIPTSGTVVFPPGVSVAVVDAVILGDRLNEATETVRIRLDNPQRLALGEAEALGFIQDDDAPPTITVENIVVRECAPDSDAVFRLILSAPTEAPVTVSYRAESGTALAGEDFTPVSGVAELEPGSMELIIRVPIICDDLPEPDEDFTLTLTEATGAFLETTSARVTILDETPPALSFSGGAVIEGHSGFTEILVNLTLTSPLAEPLSVEVATVDGAALAGEDYVALTETVVFAPGQVQQTIALRIIGDLVPETDESFSLVARNPSGPVLLPPPAVILIEDDDQFPSITAANLTVLEGDTGARDAEIVFQLSSASALPASFRFRTVSETAIAGQDYAFAEGVIEFPPGETTRTVRISILGDDLDEPDEAFLLLLTAPVNAVLLRDQIVVTIQDDDGVGLRVADATAVEGPGATLPFVVTLAQPSAVEVSVSYRTRGGSAVEGADYDPVSGTLIFAPGQTTHTVNVPVRDDAIDEIAEVMTLELFDPRNTAILRAQATGTIIDDDPPGLRVSDTAIAVSNAGPVTVTFSVTLSSPATNLVTVQYSTRDGAAIAPGDYTAKSGTLEFAPGRVELTVSVDVNANTADEREEFFLLVLSEPSGATLEKPQGAAVIFNHATPRFPPEITLDAPEDGATFAAGDDIPLSATAEDPDGSIAHVAFYNGDVLIGRRETPPYSLVWSNVVAGAHVLSARATDDQGLVSTSAVARITVAPPPRVSISDTTATEGEPAARFNLTLSRPARVPVTVQIVFREASAHAGLDFIAATNTVTFAPGETNQIAEVELVDDAIHEAEETFRAEIFAPSNATLGRADAFAVIKDDDLPPAISITDTRVVEGNAGTTAAIFLVTLSSLSDLPLTFDYATRDGTATAGADYLPVAGVQTVLPRFTNATILVSIIGDTVREPDETFELELSNPVNGRLADALAVATIVNDDLDLPPTNAPPEVVIRRPRNRTVFPPGEPIAIEVGAEDPDGVIDRVEFFVGESRLGEVRSAPFTWVWLDAPEGDHTLRARAWDRDGASADSEPIRVAVSQVCGSVAILQNVEDPEIDFLQEYLFELGVNSTAFTRSSASREELGAHDLVLWHDGGQRGLNASDVEFLASIGQNKPLYFMGDALLASMEDLDPDHAQVWRDLIRMDPEPALDPGSQIAIEPGDVDPLVALVIRAGKVGDVENSAYPIATPAGVSAGGLWDTVLARAGAAEVLVAYWNSSLPSEPRRITQTFRLLAESDETPNDARKRLFQNAIWWLLDCLRCSNLNLTPEAVASADTASVGDDVTFSIRTSLAGGCEALSVRVIARLPAGLEFVSAAASRGAWSHVQGVVTFNLGRLPRGAVEDLQVTARATRSGTQTLEVNLHSLNETSGALLDNHVSAEVVVEGGSEILIENGGDALDIVLRGPVGAAYVVETSSTLGGEWVEWVSGTFGESEVRLPIPTTQNAQFFRVR